MIIHSILDFLHELGYYTILTISGVTVEAILWTPLLTPLLYLFMYGPPRYKYLP